MRHARGHKLQRFRFELPFYLFSILCVKCNKGLKAGLHYQSFCDRSLKHCVQTLCWTNMKATAVFERCLHYQTPVSKYTLITAFRLKLYC